MAIFLRDKERIGLKFESRLSELIDFLTSNYNYTPLFETKLLFYNKWRFGTDLTLKCFTQDYMGKKRDLLLSHTFIIFTNNEVSNDENVVWEIWYSGYYVHTYGHMIREELIDFYNSLNDFNSGEIILK